MSGMTGMDETWESQGTGLCRSCGLCCTGHLFIWAKLRPSELDPAEALGLTVLRSHPRQRGFNQPCPLWQGDCTIYDSPHYPHGCRAYRCKLLKTMQAEGISLPEALQTVEQVKGTIADLEKLLPASTMPNFRERLVARLEAPGQEDADQEFRRKADELLNVYEQVFGVTDVVDKPEEDE
jgi:hypothetical protein